MQFLKSMIINLRQFWITHRLRQDQPTQMKPFKCKMLSRRFKNKSRLEIKIKPFLTQTKMRFLNNTKTFRTLKSHWVQEICLQDLPKIQILPNKMFRFAKMVDLLIQAVFKRIILWVKISGDKMTSIKVQMKWHHNRCFYSKNNQNSQFDRFVFQCNLLLSILSLKTKANKLVVIKIVKSYSSHITKMFNTFHPAINKGI